MKIAFRAWMGVGIALTLAACNAKNNDAATPTGPGSTGGDTSGNDGGSTSTDPGSGNDGGSTDPGTPDANLTLASATMEVTGRWGADIRIDIAGSDPKGATTEAVVRLLEDNGTPVNAFDTDWDGVPDAPEAPVVFDAMALGEKTFTRSITLAGVALAAPTTAKAVVALMNTSGAKSSSVTASLTKQTLAQVGDPCDATMVANHCALGSACGGNPLTCQPGTAPQIARSAYYTSTNATRILLGGTDPDQDLSSMHIEFLDHANKPVMLDLDGDQTPESTFFDLDVSAQLFDPFFIVRNDAAKSFGTSVPRIAVTPKDSAGNLGTKKTIDLAVPTVHTVGQACDAAAFDTCATGAVCSPGIAGGTNKCAQLASVRTSTCGAAPALDPAKGATRAVGIARGSSLWDPPSGCASGEAVGRPEGVTLLHLANAAATLTVTTALPETTADTIVYVIPACADGAPLACNDDTSGFSSTVSLTNVPAGDYAIIVDMAQAAGGRYGVKVDAK